MTSENHRQGHRGSGQTSGRLEAFDRFCENSGKINAKEAQHGKTSTPALLERRRSVRFPLARLAQLDRFPYKLLPHIILTETCAGAPGATKSPALLHFGSEGRASHGRMSASSSTVRDRICKNSSRFFQILGDLLTAAIRDSPTFVVRIPRRSHFTNSFLANRLCTL